MADTLVDRGVDPADVPMESEVARLRTPKGVIKYLLIASTVAATFVAMNQLFNFNFAVGAILLQNQYFYLLIAIVLPMVFLLFPAKVGSKPGPKVPWYDFLLAVVSFAVCFYLVWIGRQVVQSGWEFGSSAGAPWHLYWASYIMWALLTEALRRSSGWGLTASITFFAFYPVIADIMPGPIAGVASSLPDTAIYHIVSAESMLGSGLVAFAELVIGFLIFGAALQHTGAGTFFINFALALLGGVRGGPAKVAIFSSGLLGSMSGSVVSNVLTTGPITIPAMKRSGIRSSTAGAIEACAATGATLMPPVMGATAFVMSSFLGIPYTTVALAAVLPAALYYFALYIQIDCFAAQKGLQGMPQHELPRLGPTLRQGWHYLVVVALLVWMLLLLKRESQAPFYATALLIVIHQLFGGEARWAWKDFEAFVISCGQLFTEMMAILAGVGLLIGAFALTGLSATLTNDLLYLAGDSILGLLLMGAFASFVLGLGMSTTPCYIFLAILLAPALVKRGLDPLAVHLFIFYWGMLSFITPPVALASFSAAGIAGSPPMKTSWESMYVGSIIYFLPFFFVLNPALILNGPVDQIILLAGRAFIGTYILCGAIQGYVRGIGNIGHIDAPNVIARVLLGLGALLLATPGAPPLGITTTQFSIAALCALIPGAAIGWVAMRRRAHRIVASVVPVDEARAPSLKQRHRAF